MRGNRMQLGGISAEIESRLLSKTFLLQLRSDMVMRYWYTRYLKVIQRMFVLATGTTSDPEPSPISFYCSPETARGIDSPWATCHRCPRSVGTRSLIRSSSVRKDVSALLAIRDWRLDSSCRLLIMRCGIFNVGFPIDFFQAVRQMRPPSRNLDRSSSVIVMSFGSLPCRSGR